MLILKLFLNALFRKKKRFLPQERCFLMNQILQHKFLLWRGDSVHIWFYKQILIWCFALIVYLNYSDFQELCQLPQNQLDSQWTDQSKRRNKNIHKPFQRIKSEKSIQVKSQGIPCLNVHFNVFLVLGHISATWLLDNSSGGWRASKINTYFEVPTSKYIKLILKDNICRKKKMKATHRVLKYLEMISSFYVFNILKLKNVSAEK